METWTLEQRVINKLEAEEICIEENLENPMTDAVSNQETLRRINK